MPKNLDELELNEKLGLMQKQIRDSIILQKKHIIQYIDKTKKEMMKELKELKFSIQ
tara:strand:+ start:4450 stop:4617 length:168 start_codon:yes stop_codon:yes gene_type:complete